jgi:transaldolase
VPISFEVFADEFGEMERQARRIASWGPNVNVKIPVTNSRGEPSTGLIRRLAGDGVSLNVTALLTLDQVRCVSTALSGGAPSLISVFAGRIADTGVDPVPVMAEALAIMSAHPSLELVWASPREVLNLIQAESIGCHIITLSCELLRKLSLLGRDLGEHSLDTVMMFHRDAVAAGFRLD